MASLQKEVYYTSLILAVTISVFGCGPKPAPQLRFQSFCQKASDKMSEGNYNQALKYYRKALQINQKEPLLYRKMAYCFEKLAMTDSAVTYYEGAIVFNPGDIDAYQAIGDIYYQQKMYHEAMTWYDRGMELDYLSPRSYTRLANIYYRWREYNRAKEYYLNAITVDSTFSEAYYGLGLINCLAGDTTLAETYFLDAFNNRLHSQAAFMLGKINFDRHQLAEAEKWFDIYLDLNPDGDSAFKAEEYIRIIMIRKRAGEE